MVENVFPYSGGKSRLVKWLKKRFPQHEMYVEPFGGSASVLVNKEPSRMEIYNDIDSRVVNFFEVFRDRTDELVEWLDRTPYSRELHDKYADKYFDAQPDEMPTEDVARAGIFFYLRYSQLMSKNDSKAGFQSSLGRNTATTIRNATRNLETLRERFADVVIERRDYAKLFDHYDTPDTFFYCDPPYLTKGTDWYEGEFHHEEFWEEVQKLEGRIMISYMEVPDYVPIEEFVVHTKDFAQSQNTVHSDDKRKTKTRTEKVIMNYDPDEVPTHNIPHDPATQW